MKLHVTRKADNIYHVCNVTETYADGRAIAAECELVRGDSGRMVLRTKWSKGVIQAHITVVLGTVSLAAVQSLAVDESVVL